MVSVRGEAEQMGAKPPPLDPAHAPLVSPAGVLTHLMVASWTKLAAVRDISCGNEVRNVRRAAACR